MKPLTLTITIELPPDNTPEREAFYSMTVAELLGLEIPARPQSAPAVRPFAAGLDDEPADDAANGAPTDGRELLGWITKHGGEETQKRAVAILRGWGLPTMIKSLEPDQVGALYRELQKPARGRQKWGG